MATTTPAALAAQVNSALAKLNVWHKELADWLTGAPDGGPNGDGEYPVSSYLGTVNLQPGLQKILDLVEGPAAAADAAATESVTARDETFDHRFHTEQARDVTAGHRTAAKQSRDEAEIYRNESEALWANVQSVSATVVNTAETLDTTVSDFDQTVDLVEAIYDDLEVWRAEVQQAAADAAASAAEAAAAANFDPSDFVLIANKGAAGGVCPLDVSALIALTYIPALPISKVTGLQSALDGKQPAGNYLVSGAIAIGDVSGLQTALDGKQPSGSYAAANHTHTIAQVTGLQTALDGKQAAGSYATASDLAAKADALTAPKSFSANQTVSDAAHNNCFIEMTGSTTRTITFGSAPGAGHTSVWVNRGTVSMTIACAGGYYKNGAAASATTNLTLAPGGKFTAYHKGGGVYYFDGSGF